jgi:hypothetical protein
VRFVELVGDEAHCYRGSREGHRSARDCPCRPMAPLTSRGYRETVASDLYVHRLLPAETTHHARWLSTQSTQDPTDRVPFFSDSVTT